MNPEMFPDVLLWLRDEASMHHAIDRSKTMAYPWPHYVAKCGRCISIRRSADLIVGDLVPQSVDVCPECLVKQVSEVL